MHTLLDGTARRYHEHLQAVVSNIASLVQPSFFIVGQRISGKLVVQQDFQVQVMCIKLSGTWSHIWRALGWGSLPQHLAMLPVAVPSGCCESCLNGAAVEPADIGVEQNNVFLCRDKQKCYLLDSLHSFSLTRHKGKPRYISGQTCPVSFSLPWLPPSSHWWGSIRPCRHIARNVIGKVIKKIL